MSGFSPLSWCVLVILLWPLSGRLRWRRALRLGLVSVLVISLAAMSPLAANALLAPLERAARESPLDCRLEPPTTVVVLSGGVDHYPAAANEVDALGIASRRRMDAAVLYWRAHPSAVLIASGGAPRFRSAAESSLLAMYAMRQGVPAGTVRVETRSATTWENAREVARLWPERRRVWLATTAMHMPRARLAFAHFGVQTCPLPADFRWIDAPMPRALLPGSSALRKSEAALHEWAGLVAYHLRARLGGASRVSASANTSTATNDG